MIYVTHCHFKEDANGVLRPVHDLAPLLEFTDVYCKSVEEARRIGSLKLLNTNVRTPAHPVWDSQEAFERMRRELSDFNATVNDDYLALMGDPILIGMAMGLVMERCRTFNVLLWNKHGQCYRSKKIKQDI